MLYWLFLYGYNLNFTVILKGIRQWNASEDRNEVPQGDISTFGCHS